jgi:MerR family copper efflux transcriptional regulator
MNIGEASKASGVSAKMIRHYESIGLLRPPARASNDYRQYAERDLHELRFIARARTLGFSMKEISELLSLWRNRRRASAQVRAIAGTHLKALEQRIVMMESVRATLSELVESCHGDDRPSCPILDDLSLQR